jgi:16S rRNA (uracil1498-N3)-methyltransferase
MNLVLLHAEDFADETHVTLRGRRAEHIARVLRSAAGDAIVVGLLNGRIGAGVIESLREDAVDLLVTLDREPPLPLPLTLVLAVPRPKVLNRVIASATSMGVKEIHLVNAWRVEKSYWKSPRMAEANLRAQCIAGLEQAKDTVLPSITLHRFFREFVEGFASESRKLVAHPLAMHECPRNVRERVTLAIGPEGGFIAEEIASFERAGFEPVTMGERVLRVETAVAALIARVGN